VTRHELHAAVDQGLLERQRVHAVPAFASASIPTFDSHEETTQRANQHWIAEHRASDFSMRAVM
jgi:hypothetical protein